MFEYFLNLRMYFQDYEIFLRFRFTQCSTISCNLSGNLYIQRILETARKGLNHHEKLWINKVKAKTSTQQYNSHDHYDIIRPHPRGILPLYYLSTIDLRSEKVFSQANAQLLAASRLSLNH